MFNSKRKGEWLELRLPKDKLTLGQWEERLQQELRFPPVLLRKLQQHHGFMAEESCLRLRLFPEEKAEVAGEWRELVVLYEDDFCLVVHKPAGMPVHPAAPGQTGTLAHAVASYYEQTGQSCRIRHIHRLDGDTTGPVLYAKNEFAHLLLDEEMRQKTIQRTYWAIAQGRLHPPAGMIDAPIGKDRHNSKRRRVTPGGDPARTRYKTLEVAPSQLAGVHASLIELQLETGRTHQIRVHLQHRGAPLIGDELYGGSTRLFDRQALHGVRLSFRHPWSGETVTVNDELPEDMARLWKQLGAGSTC